MYRFIFIRLPHFEIVYILFEQNTPAYKATRGGTLSSEIAGCYGVRLPAATLLLRAGFSQYEVTIENIFPMLINDPMILCQFCATCHGEAASCASWS
jgi:hypothetical protein